ncbi:MAG: ADP-ribosylation factor-directed GTPase activating protein isoform b, partial [Planctomycetota bacterium]
LAESACGGTHRLIGIAAAVEKRRQESGSFSGTWQLARQTLEAAIELARRNQNPDGSYSKAYMHRTGWCRDLGEKLGTTGHVLEFLASAADPSTLRSQWVCRSVTHLCDVLDQCVGVDLECGVLYHALHGLVEYRRRAV